MKFKLPDQIESGVIGRNCGGQFPEWKIPEDWLPYWTIAFSTTPDICKDCALVAACTLEMSMQILMPWFWGDKEAFDVLSQITSVIEWIPPFKQ